MTIGILRWWFDQAGAGCVWLCGKGWLVDELVR